MAAVPKSGAPPVALSISVNIMSPLSVFISGK
jgi:hypothetical protein